MRRNSSSMISDQDKQRWRNISPLPLPNEITQSLIGIAQQTQTFLLGGLLTKKPALSRWQDQIMGGGRIHDIEKWLLLLSCTCQYKVVEIGILITPLVGR